MLLNRGTTEHLKCGLTLTELPSTKKYLLKIHSQHRGSHRGFREQRIFSNKFREQANCSGIFGKKGTLTFDHFVTFGQISGFNCLWRNFAHSSYIPRLNVLSGLWRVSRKPRKRFGPVKPVSKSQTWRLQSCFTHMFLKWAEVLLHTRSFSRIHLSVFRYRWTKIKMTIRTRNVSGAFEKRAPGDDLS